MLQRLSPPPSSSSASESYSVHFSRREWMNPLWNSTAWPVSGRSANEVVFPPGPPVLQLSNPLAVLPYKRVMGDCAGTHRQIETYAHACMSTPISSQAGMFGSVWILAFPQLEAAGPAQLIRHPSRCQFGFWDQAPRTIAPLPFLAAGLHDGLLSGPRRTEDKHWKNIGKRKTTKIDTSTIPTVSPENLSLL